MRYLHIANARVINPQTQTDEVTDVFVADGRIATVGRRPDAGEIEHTIDATGQWLMPGLIDLGGHLPRLRLGRSVTDSVAFLGRPLAPDGAGGVENALQQRRLAAEIRPYNCRDTRPGWIFGGH